jgi:hypothetical protein
MNYAVIVLPIKPVWIADHRDGSQLGYVDTF